MPTRNVFGWQKPCYLLGEGYARSYAELMEKTDWDRYGTGNYAKCNDCMAHCGYEPTAADMAFSNPLRLFGLALEGSADAAGRSRPRSTSRRRARPRSITRGSWPSRCRATRRRENGTTAERVSTAPYVKIDGTPPVWRMQTGSSAGMVPVAMRSSAPAKVFAV